MAWEKAKLALTQVRNCLHPGKQLAGWQGSEVDSLFLVTWFRTWLLHNPYIFSLVFSWYLFQTLELNPSCTWSHSKLCFFLWWEQYPVWAHWKLHLPLVYSMSTHFFSSIESTVMLKQMCVVDRQGMAYSVLILNQNSAIYLCKLLKTRWSSSPASSVRNTLLLAWKTVSHLFPRANVICSSCIKVFAIRKKEEWKTETWDFSVHFHCVHILIPEKHRIKGGFYSLIPNLLCF